MLTKGERTKQHIFDTAMKLIKERGFDNVSVSDICEAAGVAKGTFYVHYDAKDDIVRDSYYSDMASYMDEHFSSYLEHNQDASIRDKIRSFLILELSFSRYTGVEVTSRAFSANFAVCSPGSSVHFEKRKFTRVLRELVNQTSASDKERSFLELETIVRGTMTSWCFSGGSFDIEEVGADLIDIYLEKMFN